MWLAFILLSVLFSSMIVLFTKYGVRRTDNTLAAVIWTFLLLFLYIVFTVRNRLFTEIPYFHIKTVLLLLISGIFLTGFLWFEIRALSLGEINKVVPINCFYIIFQMLIEKFAYHHFYTWKIMALYGILFFGILLMLLENKGKNVLHGNIYLIYAFVATICYTLLQRVPSFGLGQMNTEIRKVFEMLLAFILLCIIAFMGKRQKQIFSISFMNGVAICFSAVCVWMSQWFYERARTFPNAIYTNEIQKLSIAVVIILASVFLRERLTPKSFFGMIFLTGAYLFLT